MAEFKLVISDPKTGRSVQKEIKDDSAKPLLGLKLGDTFKGESVDLPGYEFQITGGSDYAGFPMRSDVVGQARKRITAVKGVGVLNKLRKPNPKNKGWRTMEGMRQKKTVAGNTIHVKTAQVNVKITKMGRDNIFPEKAPEEKKEAAPAQK
jgi:small subunit ribosomal protein S6e